MSLPEPINWLKKSDSKYVLFGFDRADALRSWWTQRVPNITQRFFDSHFEAYDWLQDNHGEKGFGRNNEYKSQGELKRFSIVRNQKWATRAEKVQEWFDYGSLISWYGSKIEYDVTEMGEPTGEKETRTENAMWWIFKMKD